MTQTDPPRGPGQRQHSGKGARIAASIFRGLLSIALLAGGIALAVYYLETAPQADQQPPPRRATLVEVEPAQTSSHRITVEAMGTVVPASEVELHPRVSGEVIWLRDSLIPGGRLETGQDVLRLDTTDYELALQKLRTDLARAKADLEVELGNQAIARREFELLGEVAGESDPSLMLRQPQLAAAQAVVDGVQAEIDKALVNLQRTTITAPFNALVRSRAVDIGARVTESTALATLVGTDTYWVEVAIPVQQLHWLDIPRSEADRGPPAEVFDTAAWGDGKSRRGKVVRLAAELQQEGRLASLLVAVDDPLELREKNPRGRPLLLGSFVRVAIEGRRIEKAVALDRQLLHQDDTVWIRDVDGTLDIRSVEVVYRYGDRILVGNGLNAGEQLVVSDLSAPVQGMPLRVREAETESGSGAVGGLPR